MEVGENLTTYPNLTILSAETAEGLHSQLRQLRLPYKILQIYSDGKKHFCFLTSSRKVNIEKIRRNSNGSTRPES